MLKLVKTVGGTSGLPHNCRQCGSQAFVAAGQAWSCSSCGTYFPAELKRPERIPEPMPQTAVLDKASVSLKQNLEQLNALHARLKGMLVELEELVKP